MYYVKLEVYANSSIYCCAGIGLSIISYLMLPIKVLFSDLISVFAFRLTLHIKHI